MSYLSIGKFRNAPLQLTRYSWILNYRLITCLRIIYHFFYPLILNITNKKEIGEAINCLYCICRGCASARTGYKLKTVEVITVRYAIFNCNISYGRSKNRKYLYMKNVHTHSVLRRVGLQTYDEYELSYVLQTVLFDSTMRWFAHIHAHLARIQSGECSGKNETTDDAHQPTKSIRINRRPVWCSANANTHFKMPATIMSKPMEWKRASENWRKICDSVFVRLCASSLRWHERVERSLHRENGAQAIPGFTIWHQKTNKNVYRRHIYRLPFWFFFSCLFGGYWTCVDFNAPPISYTACGESLNIEKQNLWNSKFITENAIVFFFSFLYSFDWNWFLLVFFCFLGSPEWELYLLFLNIKVHLPASLMWTIAWTHFFFSFEG